MATTQNAAANAQKGQSRSRSTGSARGSQAGGAASQTGTSWTTVHLPYVTAEFHRPDVHIPSGKEISDTVDAAWRSVSREQVGYLAGLGVLAALSVIEWPVATAIGVGMVVVQRAGAGAGSRSTTSGGRSRAGSASA